MDADKIARLVEQRNKAILAARLHLRDLLAARDENEQVTTQLRELNAWASRMPDAGFNSTSPRWQWWHERPRPLG